MDPREHALSLVRHGYVFHDVDRNTSFLEDVHRPSSEFWQTLVELRQEGAIRIADVGPNFRRRFLLV